MKRIAERQAALARLKQLAANGDHVTVIADATRLQDEFKEFKGQALDIRRQSYEATGEWALALSEWTAKGCNSSQHTYQHQLERARCLKGMGQFAAADTILTSYISGVTGSDRALGQLVLAMTLEQNSNQSPARQLKLLNDALPFSKSAVDIQYATLRIPILQAALKKQETEKKQAKENSSSSAAAAAAAASPPKKKAKAIEVDDKDDELVAAACAASLSSQSGAAAASAGAGPAIKKRKASELDSKLDEKLSTIVRSLADVHKTTTELSGAFKMLKPQCIVCIERPRQVRFACAHVVCCSVCSDNIKASSSQLCPVCRAPVGNTLPVILS
jgi:hypothetical protein